MILIFERGKKDLNIQTRYKNIYIFKGDKKDPNFHMRKERLLLKEVTMIRNSKRDQHDPNSKRN